MPPRFLRTALHDVHVGAIAPSSQHLVEETLRKIGRKKLNVIVEYGSGDGVMTRRLLRALAPDGRLFAIEANVEFVEQLKRIKDDRLIVIHGKAQDVDRHLEEHGVVSVDLVISSVPFSWFNETEKQRLVADSFSVLNTQGEMVFFHQYIPAAFFVLKRVFGNVEASFVLRNLFPCFIFVAQKAER